MNRRLETEIYSLAFGGEGVGRVGGKVCFVRGAIPGEKVLFDVSRETGSYIRGNLAEILVPSADRTEPVCRYYGKCGGCQLQHISYEKELFYKKEQVVELIKRIADKNDFECGDIVSSPSPYHYRSSVTVHAEAGKAGFYAFSDSSAGEIIEIKECPVAEECINKELASASLREARGEVTLKSDRSGRVWSSARQGERFFADRYSDMDLYFSPKAFSQANRYIAEKIAEKLEEWVGPADRNAAFFDAYCGIGFFTFLLRQEFGIRVGMDASRMSINCAKNTVRAANLQNIKFYGGQVEQDFIKVFENLKRDVNVLLLDPPRAGMDKDFLDKIKQRSDIDSIYYVSCDPARLARDIKILTEDSGWVLDKVAIFDMFPRTKHIETMAAFERRK